MTSARLLVLVAVAALASCDAREPKPKVGSALDLRPIASAWAQQADQVVPPSAVKGVMAPMDEAFVLFAISNSLAEIEAARLVIKGTKCAAVREYAQSVARDHGRLAEDLRRIVAPRGPKLPVMPTGRHADMVTKLTGLSAQDLDGAFLQRFGIDATKEALALFERETAEGKDPDLRSYALQALDTLRGHMAVAHKLVNAAGAGR
jgi:putative membrane protein